MEGKKHKVYFVHCARYNNIAPIVTMGLWGLADYISKYNYEVKIINTKSEELVNGKFDIKDYIDDDVLAIGFSVHWFPGMKEALDISKEIKRINSGIKIFFGGYTSSFYSRELLERYDFIDAVVKGDGEIPTLSFLECVVNDRKEYSDVPNLVWKDGNQIVENQFNYVSTAEDLANCSYANFSKYLNNYKYCKDVEPFNMEFSKISNFHVTDFKPRKTFFLLTGKGCVVNCAFCGGGQEAQKIINNRCSCMFLDNDQVVDTVKSAISHGYNSFYVCFDPLPKNPKYIEWLRKLAEEKLDIDLVFGFWALPEENVIKEFKKVTNNLIFEISPESISERVRKKVRGFNFSNSEFYNSIDKLYKEKIYTWVYFSYPLPFETIEEIKMTRQTFWEINSEYEHYIEAFYLKQSTDPGSQIYCNPEKFDIEISTFDIEEHMKQGDECIGNILIHANKADKLEREALYKKILLDNTLKKIFNYSMKYFVKAFNNIHAFIKFIDKFYDELGLNKLSSEEILVEKLLEFTIKEYSKKEVLFDNYLIELISFMNSQIKAYNLAPMSVNKRFNYNIESLSGKAISLSESILLVELKYDLYNAYKMLILEKKFAKIDEVEMKYYMLINYESGINFIEINESLYLLLKCVENNVGIKINDVAKEVACTYAEDEKEYDFIYKDLENTLINLVNQEVLIIKKEF